MAQQEAVRYDCRQTFAVFSSLTGSWRASSNVEVYRGRSATQVNFKVDCTCKLYSAQKFQAGMYHWAEHLFQVKWLALLAHCWPRPRCASLLPADRRCRLRCNRFLSKVSCPRRSLSAATRTKTGTPRARAS